MSNPYQILRVQPNASPEQIEDAYHRMRRLVSYGNAGVTEQAVTIAYNILSDPLRRARIDSAIGRRRRPGAAAPAAGAAGAAREGSACEGSAAPARVRSEGFYARLRRILPFL